MIAYLLGLVTLPALYALYVVGVMVADWVAGWGRRECFWCGALLPYGPRFLRSLHSRWRHGLALTIRGRIRRKQWHGLAYWIVKEHGVSPTEHQALVQAAKNAAHLSQEVEG